MKNKDVVGGGGVKNANGKIVVEESKINEIWRTYFEKLLNEEFDWNRNGLDMADAVAGPAELLSVEEIRLAIAKAKSGKAAGPSGVMVDMLKVSGKEGAEWVTDLCNAVVRDGRILNDEKELDGSCIQIERRCP